MGAPVQNTCPDIDKGIKLIEDAMSIIKCRRKEIDSKSEEDDVLWDILAKIEDVPSIFEQLRRDNDALRTWGHTLNEEVENSANYINELEEKIEKMK